MRRDTLKKICWVVAGVLWLTQGILKLTGNLTDLMETILQGGFLLFLGASIFIKDKKEK